jgi:1-deoxy-D-xylulose-5-phosphate reductoisomerase
MRRGNLWGAAFNAAKEVALDRFIGGDIGFLDMAILVEKALHDMDQAGLLGAEPRDLSDVLQADQATRERARTINV